jgi:hypothetical protein
MLDTLRLWPLSRIVRDAAREPAVHTIPSRKVGMAQTYRKAFFRSASNARIGIRWSSGFGISNMICPLKPWTRQGSLIQLRLVGQEYRNRHRRQQRSRDAPEHQLAWPGVPVAASDDEIRANVAGVIEKGVAFRDLLRYGVRRRGLTPCRARWRAISVAGTSPSPPIPPSGLMDRTVTSSACHTVAKKIPEGDALLNYAGDIGADLVVAGGYGHSRARELVSGASRERC